MPETLYACVRFWEEKQQRGQNLLCFSEGAFLKMHVVVSRILFRTTSFCQATVVLVISASAGISRDKESLGGGWGEEITAAGVD